MFTLENLPLLIIVALLLLFMMPILQFITFLYYRLRYVQYETLSKEEVENNILEIIQPLESFLQNEGFEYRQMLKHNATIIGNEQIAYIAYYFNVSKGIHAFIHTQPYQGALEPANIIFETIFKDHSVVTTFNGQLHGVPASPSNMAMFDHYLGSHEEIYKAHLKDRTSSKEEISYDVFDKEGLEAYKSYMDEHVIGEWIEQGYAKKESYGYKFRPTLKVFLFAINMVKGNRKFSKVLKTKSYENIDDDITNKNQIHAMSSQLKDMSKPRGETNKILWFSISMIAFVVLFGILGLDILDIFALVLVLIVHELGHFLAMRFFGYTDTSIFFLPFGAVTVGKKEKRVAFEEYIVSLAGPVPGILIGIFILISVTQYGSNLNSLFVNTYAIISIVVNYINLLPIYPLDGGRVLQTLFLLRYPKGQFYFYVISLLILATGMVLMQDALLLIFVVLLAFGLKGSYRISKLLEALFKTKKQEDITQNDVLQMLTTLPIYKKETLSSKVSGVQQVMMLLQTSKPKKRLMFFGFSFYLLLLTPLLLVGFFLGDSFMHQSALSPKTTSEMVLFDKTITKYQDVVTKDNLISEIDKNRHQELLIFLKLKSKEYLSSDRFLQTMLLMNIEYTKDKEMIPFVKPYLYSEHETTQRAAMHILKKLKE